MRAPDLDRPGRPLERRRFIRSLALGAGALAAGSSAALTGCSGLVVHEARLVSGTLSIPESRFGELEGAEGVVGLGARGLSHPVLLMRAAGGGYLALSSVCTHLGCTVRPTGKHLVCPCHGSTFDTEGRVVRGPAREPLRTFPVRVAAGRIEVELSG